MSRPRGRPLGIKRPPPSMSEAARKGAQLICAMTKLEQRGIKSELLGRALQGDVNAMAKMCGHLRKQHEVTPGVVGSPVRTGGKIAPALVDWLLTSMVGACASRLKRPAPWGRAKLMGELAKLMCELVELMRVRLEPDSFAASEIKEGFTAYSRAVEYAATHEGASIRAIAKAVSVTHPVVMAWKKKGFDEAVEERRQFMPYDAADEVGG